MQTLPQFFGMFKNQNLIFSLSNSIAILQCFTFLIRVKCQNFHYLDSILKFAGKNLVYQLLSWFGIYTDPDPAK
jgi:hypothetical protein